VIDGVISQIPPDVQLEQPANLFSLSIMEMKKPGV
jgi:hypothetical protein